MIYNMKTCKICYSSNIKKKFEYFKKPKLEKKYASIDYKNYNRTYYKCGQCDHFSGFSKMFIGKLYTSEYNNSIYSGMLKKNFDKIKKLPSFKSDNYYRVKRIHNFIKQNKDIKNNQFKILDVGSGLGIFPYQMKKKNYNITALDPDKRSCIHIKKNLGIRTIHGDFLKSKLKTKFNLITLNKVIEHVVSPEKMIKKVKKNLNLSGIVYIEAPDIKAQKKGKNREEFHVDHLHIFSKKSLLYLTQKNNLRCILIKSIKEPSGKFTVFGFFQKKLET